VSYDITEKDLHTLLNKKEIADIQHLFTVESDGVLFWKDDAPSRTACRLILCREVLHASEARAQAAEARVETIKAVIEDKRTWYLEADPGYEPPFVWQIRNEDGADVTVVSTEKAGREIVALHNAALNAEEPPK